MSLPIEIRKATLETCHAATGVVVIVDVLRAFTTAACAFDRGAEEMLLVSSVDEAFELRARDSRLLLIGEVDGLPIDGFDLPNSPSALEALDLRERRLVQRTSSGTQGAVRATSADRLFAASLCVASATAERIRDLAPHRVTFVETGVRSTGGGEEDVACADYIASLLLGDPLEATVVAQRVRASRAAAKFSRAAHPAFPSADLERALEFDRFAFAMTVERVDDSLLLRAVR